MNVVQLPHVEISDFAKVLLALEVEKSELDTKSASITADIAEVWRLASERVLELSNQQRELLERRVALEDSIFQLLQSKVIP